MYRVCHGDRHQSEGPTVPALQVSRVPLRVRLTLHSDLVRQELEERHHPHPEGPGERGEMDWLTDVTVLTSISHAGSAGRPARVRRAVKVGTVAEREGL